jgi:hypothetical protein
MTINIEALKALAIKSGATPDDLSSLTFAAAAYPSAFLALIERVEAAEARCAELQSHQDDYDRAHAGIEAAERDAARYRWLREQHWHNSSLHVLSNPNKHHNLLGLDCPSGERLDFAIDAAIAKGKA